MYLRYECPQKPVPLPALLPPLPLPSAPLPSLPPAAPVAPSSPQFPAPTLMLSLTALEVLLSPAAPVTPAVSTMLLSPASDAQLLPPTPPDCQKLDELMLDEVGPLMTPCPAGVLPPLIVPASLPPTPLPLPAFRAHPPFPTVMSSLPCSKPKLPLVAQPELLVNAPPATPIMPSLLQPPAPAVMLAPAVPQALLCPTPFELPAVPVSSLPPASNAPSPQPAPTDHLLPTGITPAPKPSCPAAPSIAPAVPAILSLPRPAQVLSQRPLAKPDKLLPLPDDKALELP